MLVGRGRGSRLFEERAGLRGGVGRLHLWGMLDSD